MVEIPNLNFADFVERNLNLKSGDFVNLDLNFQNSNVAYPNVYPDLNLDYPKNIPTRQNSDFECSNLINSDFQGEKNWMCYFVEKMADFQRM